MKYYLTTPIYYTNAAPHIGHAYTTIVADAIRRLKKMQGYEVVLASGTDELNRVGHFLAYFKATVLHGPSPSKMNINGLGRPLFGVPTLSPNGKIGSDAAGRRAAPKRA